jgi:hypothetical protein
MQALICQVMLFCLTIPSHVSALDNANELHVDSSAQRNSSGVDGHCVIKVKDNT